MASLEEMVPDVLFLMLANAPSMGILWAFIRASPRMYSVFREQRDVILATVITREIGHGVLGDARTAFHTSQFKPRGLSLLATIEWAIAYQTERKAISVSLLSGTLLSIEALPLWRLHRKVKFFADLVVRRSLRILTRGSEVLPNTKSPPPQHYSLDDLSDIEKMRIYRSIYRYAIYGDLFYFDQDRSGLYTRPLPSAYDQSNHFLSLFPAWQVEELSCINDLIRDIILEKWREAEDYFYAILADDPSSWDIDREDPWNSRWEDTFFSRGIKLSSHGEWRRYLASLTLSDLKDVFLAKEQGLIEILEKQSHHMLHDFLTEALNEFPYHSSFLTPEFEEHKQALASGMKVQFQGDSIDEPNEAWLWAHEYQPCELYVLSTSEFPIGKGLRRFGYVFWDSDRLHNSGIFEKNPAEVCYSTLKTFPRPLPLEDSVEDRIRELSQSLQVSSS